MSTGEPVVYFVGERYHIDMQGMPVVADDGTEFFIDPALEWESLCTPGKDEMRWKPEQTEGDK